MKKELFQEIEIPEGVEISIKDGELTAKGKNGEIKRKFDNYNLVFEKKGNIIKIGNEKATKKEKKQMNSITAHIKNIIKGASENFEYQLKICFHHFPITVELKDKEATIKNFLGEKTPRKLKIPSGVEVTISQDLISVQSNDKELAGQAAANFEKATRIKKRDRRVFQDGIFMINKAGKII